MSAISLPAIAIPSTQQVPFCDKRFQRLRALVSCICDVCLAIVLKIAAFFVSICSKRSSDYLRSLATYYQDRSGHFSSHLTFGRKIIDFSLNMGKPKTGHTERGLEGLQKVYGKEMIAYWSTIGTAETTLSEAELLFKNNRPCCFGMSLDFIARYFKELQKNKTPLEAVKAIAPVYAEGAPVEAEVAQIFYEALDGPLLRAHFNSLVQERGRLAEEFAQSGQITCRQETISARMTVIQSELRQITQLHNLASGAVTAKKMGLTFRHIGDCKTKPIENKQMDSNFLQFVNGLNEGVYEIGLRQATKAGTGHSIVFIKGAAEHFIFDPSLGTLALAQKGAIELWILSQGYGKESLAFSSITQS